MTFDTLRGPNPYARPELKHPALIEAEEKLAALLKEETQYRKRITRIEEMPFAEVAAFVKPKSGLSHTRLKPESGLSHTRLERPTWRLSKKCCS